MRTTRRVSAVLHKPLTSFLGDSISSITPKGGPPHLQPRHTFASLLSDDLKTMTHCRRPTVYDDSYPTTRPFETPPRNRRPAAYTGSLPPSNPPPPKKPNPWLRTVTIQRPFPIMLGGSLPQLELQYIDYSEHPDWTSNNEIPKDMTDCPLPVVYIMPSMSHSAHVCRPEFIKKVSSSHYSLLYFLLRAIIQYNYVVMYLFIFLFYLFIYFLYLLILCMIIPI